MHPETKTLVAYGDGRLGRVAKVAVRLHLRTCADCALELKRLTTREAQREALPGATAEPGLEGVLARVRHWRDTESPAEVRARVAEELRPLLGIHGARVVLDRVADDNHDLLSHIETVLRLFLGPHAAASVVHRVVDDVIARR